MTRIRGIALSSFVVSVFATALAATPVLADEPSPLTLCLAGAADDSPVYPLKEVFATNREVVAVFRLRQGETAAKMTHVWTAVDVGDAAPANTEITRGDLDVGESRHGLFRFTLPNDLPVGKYRLDVLADGKPWASLEFPVVAPKEVKPVESPAALLPLDVGTTWVYSFLFEPGDAKIEWKVEGAEKGPDGKIRATMTLKAAAQDEAGTRIEMRRNDALVNEEWWRLDAAGLSLTRERRGGQTTAHDPAVTLVPLPLQSGLAWEHKGKDGSVERESRMWGPLPVVGPKGEARGWIVWTKQPTPNGLLTIERHFVRGVGVVREVQVQAAGATLLNRIEVVLQPPK